METPDMLHWPAFELLGKYFQIQNSYGLVRFENGPIS